MFLAIVAAHVPLLAQQAAPAPTRFERIYAVVPITGSGTKTDPKRPEYAPAEPTPGVRPDGSGILGYSCLTSDDQRFALCEFVARDRTAFQALLADRRPEVKVFEKGLVPRAQIEAAFKALKPDFDLRRLEAYPQ
ncbi:MAG: hypothetical protein HY858_16480 [Candidatus Solibacter usitatus]|nr:hypothetical protein [Candidatus Solibacter usitatus]